MYQTARFDYQDVPIIAMFSKSNVTRFDYQDVPIIVVFSKSNITKFDHQDVPIIAVFSKSNVIKYVITCQEFLLSNWLKLLSSIDFRAVLEKPNLTT
jgi:hypothetical protein